MRVKTNKRKGNMRQKGEEKKERQIHILPLILECLSRRSCSGSCSAYYLCLLGFYLRSWSHSKWCRTPSYIWSQPMSPTFSSFWFHLFFAGVCTSNKLSVLRRRNVKKERKEKKKEKRKEKKTYLLPTLSSLWQRSPSTSQQDSTAGSLATWQILYPPLLIGVEFV